jgi:methenyltetrahydrofolate cyclohydrolase
VSLEEALDRLASANTAPGAGAAAAWCCALAAALVEMVARVALAGGEGSAAMERRLQRAGELRTRAVSLADEDAAAYKAAIDAAPERRAEALSAAADPPLAIAEAAAETGKLAAAASAEVKGPIRGEADTAALISAAATRSAARLIELNLAGSPEDPRLARARELADIASA